MSNAITKNLSKISFLKQWERMQDSAGHDALESLGEMSKTEFVKLV